MLPLPGEPRTPAQDRLGSSATEILLLLGITHQAASNVPLATPLNAGCRGKCVFDSGQNKTHTFSKREQKSFSAYHKHPALMQPVCTTVSTPCHTGRDLAGHPRCVSMGNGYGKTRLYSSIRSKTTAFLRCTRHHSVQRGRPSPLHNGDESVVKRSHRNRSSSPEWVRLLQPLLPRPHKKMAACDLF